MKTGLIRDRIRRIAAGLTAAVLTLAAPSVPAGLMTSCAAPETAIPADPDIENIPCELKFLLDSLAEYQLPDDMKEKYEALREAARQPDWERIRELL